MKRTLFSSNDLLEVILVNLVQNRFNLYTAETLKKKLNSALFSKKNRNKRRNQRYQWNIFCTLRNNAGPTSYLILIGKPLSFRSNPITTIFSSWHSFDLTALKTGCRPSGRHMRRSKVILTSNANGLWSIVVIGLDRKLNGFSIEIYRLK